MDTSVEMRNVGQDVGGSSFRQPLWWFLLMFPLFGTSVFIYAFFFWPWEGREALVGINLVEVVFDFMFQGFYAGTLVVLASPLLVYTATSDEKRIMQMLKRESKASVPARLLLYALAVPFICATLFFLFPIFCGLIYVFVLWMGAGQFAESFALLPGYGDKALKQLLWLFNLCLLHGVLSMLLAWMAHNARSKWSLGLKQKGLNLSCLGVFLVLYWQFSGHYGVKFTDLLDMYYFDPEIPMGAFTLSMLFLACSAVAVWFLSVRSMSFSLKDVGQIALNANSGGNLSEEKRQLVLKYCYPMILCVSILFFVYMLGASYA